MNSLNILQFSPAILAFIAIAFAGACFQLGTSVLTLLSSHALGAKRSHRKLGKLILGYLFGSILATSGLALVFLYAVDALVNLNAGLSWLVLASLSWLVGLLLVIFYYRKSRGTSLWIPRSVAVFLSRRTKRTKSAVETFSLGVFTALAELPFSFVVLLALGYFLAPLPGTDQLYLVGIYALAVNLPQIVIAVMVAGGHKISTIQRWRETNKNFLKWSSGICLILLGTYLASWHLFVEIA